MEYFSSSLKQVIKKNIPVKAQKMIIHQILLALIEMKQKGVLHRDLKP